MSFDCFSLCQFVHAKHVLPDQLLLFLSLLELLQIVHAKHVLLDQLLLFLPVSLSLKRVHAKHVFSPLATTGTRNKHVLLVSGTKNYAGKPGVKLFELLTCP